MEDPGEAIARILRGGVGDDPQAGEPWPMFHVKHGSGLSRVVKRRAGKDRSRLRRNRRRYERGKDLKHRQRQPHEGRGRLE